MSRSRTQLLFFAALALTILLGVVAFVSRGHSAPAGGGSTNRGASQLLANTMFTIWFLVMAFGAVMLVLFLAQGRHQQRQTRSRMRPVLQFVILVVILVLVATLGPRLSLFHWGKPAQNQPAAARLSGALKSAEKRREARQHKVQAPSFDWPLALAVIALVAGVSVGAFLRAKARRSKLSDEVKLIQEIRLVLDETLDDLRNEADPRKAVIAAYARMERLLGVHGWPRRPSEAPQEYLMRVLADLRVTQPALERLTELFTRAKFSHHDVDPQMKDDAIDALLTFRDQIEVIGRPYDKPALNPSQIPGAAR